jgi:molybdopterin-guanine dinucleotide biosynthesis protein A
VGPLGGLLSAFFHHRDKDWFLLSSAMPFVTLRELSQLREAAEGNQMATAFTNSQGLPVVQCAIYHAAYKDILLTEAKAGERSLQNILMKHGFQALQAKDPNIFDAVVTQDDYYEAQKRIVGV